MNEIRKHKWFTTDFFDRKWTIESKQYSDYDVNGTYYSGGVVGINRTLNNALRFNPTSNKMLNLKLFPCTPAKLQKESGLIKEFTKRIIKTNTLTAFTRSASITTEDYKKKKNPTDLLDKAYLVLAQIILETKCQESITQLKQLDIADDIIVEDPKIAKWAIRFLNFAVQDIYEEERQKIDTIKNKIAFQKRLSVGSSRKLHTIDLQNLARSRSHVAYTKGDTQLLNKVKTTFAENKIADGLYDHLEKHIKNIENIIRIETHLSSTKAITDPASYERHKSWKELVVAAIEYTQSKEGQSIINECELFENKMRPAIRNVLYQNILDVYETPPTPAPAAYG